VATIEAKGILKRRRSRLAEKAAAVREAVIVECLARKPELTREAVEEQLAELESDRPFLDWLASGGFEKIIALILRLLGLGV